MNKMLEIQLRKVSAMGALYDVQNLIKQGVDVKASDSEGDTALHRASYSRRSGTPNIIQLLVVNGASWTVEDKNNQTPLDFIIETERQDLVASSIIEYSNAALTQEQKLERLQQHLKELNKITYTIDSPEFEILQKIIVPINQVRELIARGADVKAPSQEGDIVYMPSNSNNSSVQSDINKLVESGKTPLEFMISSGQQDLVAPSLIRYANSASTQKGKLARLKQHLTELRTLKYPINSPEFKILQEIIAPVNQEYQNSILPPKLQAQVNENIGPTFTPHMVTDILGNPGPPPLKKAKGNNSLSKS